VNQSAFASTGDGGDGAVGADFGDTPELFYVVRVAFAMRLGLKLLSPGAGMSAMLVGNENNAVARTIHFC
jgi:hypothetical protein